MKSIDLLSHYIDPDTTVFWFRRDLRLSDNAALYHALTEHGNVLPLFIFDQNILGQLEDSADRRVDFIHQTLSHLGDSLAALGSTLLVVHATPEEVFRAINPKAVYTNHDYEPYARDRDETVNQILKAKGVVFRTFKDQVIFEKNEVLKDNGEPYTVYTPYSKKWKSKVNAFFVKAYPTEKYFRHFKKNTPARMPALESMGFKPTGSQFPESVIRQEIIAQYDKWRDFPAVNGTSRLSVHLRFGTLSIRQLVQTAMQENNVWLNELIWREFYQAILWHFPNVDRAFKPAYDNVKWLNNETQFDRWRKGNTGYPIVDAGMRELNETGYMHNRVRMITASFLTKHLLIDWRWGEAYFAQKLLDFDLAANNGGWQWAAGSGCDAAPYFRVFNPALQAARFDPDKKYIRRWVPEVDAPDYPVPIIDHTTARQRALDAYKRALS